LPTHETNLWAKIQGHKCSTETLRWGHCYPQPCCCELIAQRQIDRGQIDSIRQSRLSPCCFARLQLAPRALSPLSPLSPPRVVTRPLDDRAVPHSSDYITRRERLLTHPCLPILHSVWKPTTGQLGWVGITDRGFNREAFDGKVRLVACLVVGIWFCSMLSLLFVPYVVARAHVGMGAVLQPFSWKAPAGP